MVVMLGVIDDLRPLGPGLKLIGQAIAVLVLMRAGLYIKIAALPPGICLVLTFFWLMATINGFNIIDIMDGLASGVACIASAVLFIVAVYQPANHDGHSCRITVRCAYRLSALQ